MERACLRHSMHPVRTLIILDIMMPGMDGFALCTAIRRRGRVPIIIVSAKDAPMDQVTGITLGSDDYMVKPFLPSGAGSQGQGAVSAGPDTSGRMQETLVCANLSLDPRSRCMTVDGAPLFRDTHGICFTVSDGAQGRRSPSRCF